MNEERKGQLALLLVIILIRKIGIFSGKARDAVDDLTKEPGVTREEVEEFALELGKAL